MHWIPAKLRLIRQEFNLTQLEAAQASGLSQRDISQLENGRKEGLPKEYIRFLHSRGVDLNWLFTDPALESNSIPSLPKPASVYSVGTEETVAAVAEEDVAASYRQPSSQNATPQLRMVEQKRLNEYPTHCQQADYIQALPVSVLPLAEVQQGTVRAFQVEDATPLAFCPGDWVIAQLLASWEQLRVNKTYVIVTTSAVQVGQLAAIEREKNLLRLSAPADGAEAEVSQPDIREIWEVIGHLSFQLAVPASSNPVATLEASLQDLLSRVQRLEQGR